MLRVGFGYDVHQLVKGRDLIIGGRRIPYELGLKGHSDADVLVHAIMDGILGAMAKGDIGTLFPDTDPAFQDRDSMLMLEEVMRLVRKEGWQINNLDSTIVAQRPKMAPHLPVMKDVLSKGLGVEIDQVSIKATTTEGLGFSGRGEGIAAYAIVSLIKV
ncbi:MAG: 2-C-methyl-D-erythritol 2,4-cyclodiphosphate synthase [Deltaproteobacteria bacterium]|nr:2-C-methyl-D-erythritol 2,4-cyclodiphosphate synthase [Deltaproteobacteria bacterium]MBW1914386.1 2-C-methyl-D-erythritol 2,4-cyclodiphosphate synthase [Deltaproteobacteria bacterium]